MWYTFCAKPMILIDRIVTLRCRSPCGERGLKCFPSEVSAPGERRSPCGERGLKSLCGHGFLPPFSSLPVRGAWIEMPFRRLVRPPRGGRSPCGERGLKCYFTVRVRQMSKSLPVRGAWIEIAGGSGGGWPLWSLPVRGAWIEICVVMVIPPSCGGRSPCGERGLKWLRGG